MEAKVVTRKECNSKWVVPGGGLRSENEHGFRVNDAGPGILSAFYGDDTTPHTIHIHDYMTCNPDELLSDYKRKLDDRLAHRNAKLTTTPVVPHTSLSKTDVPPNETFGICRP